MKINQILEHHLKQSLYFFPFGESQRENVLDVSGSAPYVIFFKQLGDVLEDDVLK